MSILETQGGMMAPPAPAPMILEAMMDQRKNAQAQATEDRETISFKTVRALMKTAQNKSAVYRQTFERDWQFLLGENHQPVPKNMLAAARVKNRNQGIRNWLYATCDQKAQMILGAKTQYTAVPYGAPVDFISRWQAQEIIEEVHRQCRADEFDEDCVWDGMATGKGYCRVLVKADPRSGLPRLELESVDPSRVYPDSYASKIADCDILHYNNWMPMPKIREAFPNVDPKTGAPAWMKVNPKKIPITDPDLKRDSRSRTDQELLSGGGYEMAYDAKGALCELGADVCFTWIRNEEIINEYAEKQVSGERTGYSCAQCGDVFDEPHYEPPDTEIGMDESIPSAPQCPSCNSEALAPITIPAEIDRTLTGKKFRYPYGQLIVHCEDGILWQGPNPDKIDCIFPIFEYHHHRSTRRFNGQGEVQKLRTAQVNANKNMAQLMDYLRTCTNGILEYPGKALTYGALSNMPNAKIGLPVQLIGLARWLPPPTFPIQAFVTAEETIRRDFQEMGGITDSVYGTAPSAPTSGKEVVARQQAANTRIDGHIRRLCQMRSARGTAMWQLLWQHWRNPRFFPIRNSDGEPEMEMLTISQMPRNMKIHVSANIEDAQRSEITTQAIQVLLQQGIIPQSLDLLLPTMGLKTWESQQLMDRALLMRHEQAQMDPAMQGAQAQFGMGQGPMPPQGPPPTQ